MSPTIGSVTVAVGASSASLSPTAAVGDTLVACVGAENATPTITGAVTWTRRVDAVGGGYPHNVSILTGPVTTGGTQSLTIGPSGAVDAVVYVIGGDATVDAVASAGGGGALGQAVSGLVVTRDDCLLIGMWGTEFGSADAAASYTTPSGWTQRANQTGQANFVLFASYSLVQASAGSVSATATSNNAGLGWSGALISLASGYNPPTSLPPNISVDPASGIQLVATRLHQA